MDKVILKGVSFELPVGLDAWRRPSKPQPIHVDLEVQPTANFEVAAAKDDVSLTMDYGKMYKRILAKVHEVEAYPNAVALISAINSCVSDFDMLDVKLAQPKALLPALGGIVYHQQLDLKHRPYPTLLYTVALRKLACSCLIGVNDHERIYKQSLFLDVTMPVPLPGDGQDPAHAIADETLHDLAAEIVERVNGSSYLTVEALATAVAQIVTLNHGFTSAKVLVEKPSAIATVGAAAVEITRDKSFFESKDFWKVKIP